MFLKYIMLIFSLGRMTPMEYKDKYQEKLKFDVV